MQTKSRLFFHVIVLAALVLLLVGPGGGVRAAGPEATVLRLLKPSALATTRGTVAGAVGRLWVRDQSGTADNPLKYVLFRTPSVSYDGYRTYKLPAAISAGDVTSLKVTVNYKGPAKAAQTWSWWLYDWVLAKWVKVGDNTGAAANLWKLFNFTMTANATHYVHNVSHLIRVRLLSNNAVSDAKIDYEVVTAGYNNACTDPLGCVTIPPGAPIHIGYLLSNTGPAAGLSLDQRRGAAIAIQKAGGKILNHPVKFDGRDGACNGPTALASAQKMVVDASLVAIVGTSCSGEAMAAMPVFSQRGFSMVSPSNTNFSLTEPGNPNNHPGYLRVSWNDKEHGTVAAQFAWDLLGVTTAATIHDGDWYSQTIVDRFITKFTALGGTITTQETIDPNATDFSTVLNDIAADPPGLIFMPVYLPAGGYLIDQARVTTGLTTTPLMGAEPFFTPDVEVIPGADANGVLATAGPNADKFSAAYASEFVPAFTLRYGSPPDPMGFAPYGYDAFMVIKAAIEDAAVPQLPAGTLQIGRQALRDALYKTSGFAGLTGTLTCSATGDCADLSSAIAGWQYDAAQNKFLKIWPP